MKDFVNSIIALFIGGFLFFQFSNFHDVNDLLQSFKSSVQTQNELKSESYSDFERAIIKDIKDGDTIEVEFSDGRIETVRLLLVDTPESVKPNTPVQPFGKEASDYIRKTLIKGNVVEIEKGKEERDKYNRLLAYVWKDGELINELLVRKGLARIAYVYEPNAKYLDKLRKAENEAKKERKGIWSIDGYVSENGFNYP